MALNKKLFVNGGGGGLVPSANFTPVLYSGNSTARNIPVGFKPDLVWIKNRNNSDNSTHDHRLFDSVRSSGFSVKSNSPLQEEDKTAWFSGISSNGFGLTNALPLNDGTTNGTYVAWCWKFGGKENTFNKDGVGFSSASAAGLTAGTTAPSASSVNTVAGHSMVKVTTASGSNKTVPHGLGVKPDLIIWKRLDSQEEGWTFTDVISGADDNNGYLILNSTAARANASEAAPTTTVVSQPTTGVKTYVVYMFASIAGFSKIGSYTGNNSLTGNVIDCGFEPSWVMIKQASGSGTRWVILDNKRNTSNRRNTFIFADGAFAEGTEGSLSLNFTSIGFQYSSTTGAVNASMNAGVTYLFYAIA